MSTAITTTPRSSVSPFNFSSPSEVIAQMQAIEDELARAAFSRFEQRGLTPGSALDDWLSAEASLLKAVPISIEEKGDRLTVKAEVPGFLPEQLKVSVDGNMLSICGTEETTQKDRKTSGDGPQESTFTRKIHCKVSLSSNVDSKRASATLDKGVLTLIFPKMDTSTKIKVKAV